MEVYEYLTQADRKTENLAHEQRRLHARYTLKKKFREIAADEGVSGSYAAESVTSAVRRLKKFFEKNGWMPKEA